MTSLLAAVTTLVSLELLRAAGTAAGSAAGSAAAGLLTIAAAAGLAGPLVQWLGSRRALPVALGALAACRLLVQLPAARTAPVLALAAGAALGTLVLVLRRCAATSPATGNGPGRTARAVALAVAADVALRLPLDLLDPVWRGGAPGWLAALVLSGLLAVLARWARRLPATPERPYGSAELALVGPLLALWALLLAAPGHLAARAGLSVTAAGLWIAAGALLGIGALSLRRPLRFSPAVLIAAGWGFAQPGPLPGPDALAAPAACAALAALPPVLRGVLALPPRTTGRGPLADLAFAGGGSAFGYLLLALPHQLSSASFPFALLALLAALAPAGAASRAPAPDRPLGHAFRPVLLATLLLAAPPLLNALRAAPGPLPTDTAGGTYRLLSWNVHHAVDRDGDLAPEAIADVIEDSGAHVVVLQEVPRGRVGAGGLDLTAWLERRLDATAVWARSADRHTGNLILTSLPVLDSATAGLPHDRSYARATVRLTDGETARIVTTHLDGGDSPDARLAQLAPLLRDAVGDEPGTVLAGDLNARPGSPEMATAASAGLTHSAQDEAGDPERDTAVSPPRRVDWILGSAGVSFADFTLPATTASDHLPLTTTVFLD